MQIRRLLLLSMLSAGLVFPASQDAPAQNAVPPDAAASGVVLTKLFPLVYPPLARQALIIGDVILRLQVRQDGTLQSAEVVSGHPILKEAALESAQKSQFECRGCSSPETSFSMTYTFSDEAEVDPDPCCCTEKPNAPANSSKKAAPEPQIKRFSDHTSITVKAPPVCMCPDRCTIEWAEKHSRFRAAKCLYLWKCGYRFIGVM
jgi:TonB family protein